MPAPEPRRLLICTNEHCGSRGSEELLELVRAMLHARGDPDGISVELYSCFGGCDDGPNMIVHPDCAWYVGVEEGDLPEIVDHLMGVGPRVSRLETADEAAADLIFTVLDAGG